MSNSPCSESCGAGNIVHMRECTTQDNHLSEDCPGTSSKVEECKLTECILNDPGTNTTAQTGQVKHKVLFEIELYEKQFFTLFF